MVEQDIDYTQPIALVLEEAIEKIEELFKEGLKHKEVGEHLIQLEASVKGGKVTKKDGSPVAEDTQEFKDFMDTDLARLEMFAAKNAEEFFEALEEKEYMEEFKDKDLLELDCHIYHKIGEEKGQTILEVIYPSPIHVLASIFVEVDLIHHWMEGMKTPGKDSASLQVYERPTNFLTAMHADNKIGENAYHMDLNSVAYLDRKINGILNIGGSIERDTWFGKPLIAPKYEESKQMKLSRSFRYFEKLDDKKCKHVIYSDFAMAPGMDKEKILEHLKGQGTTRIKGMMATYDETIAHYEKRVNGEKKEFYDKIKAIFADE